MFNTPVAKEPASAKKVVMVLYINKIFYNMEERKWVLSRVKSVKSVKECKRSTPKMVVDGMYWEKVNLKNKKVV